ncbi:uncharacterized protein LOC127474895 [Manacus candei]|uniref:uncharacterized protein LOC127474895 n=1 Tax=Manacus candei TaxID=415023 RepID=UPI00222724B0|nr:uncharacterized protein LOC127474895 [Manacus candei]
MPIHRKGPKEHLDNSWPVPLTSGPGKSTQQILLCAIPWHGQDNQGIRPRQRGVGKGRSCLTNLISFSDKGPTQQLRERLGMCLCRIPESLWHHLPQHLLHKLAAHGLPRGTVCWVTKCLMAQGAVGNGRKSRWGQSLVGSPRAQGWGCSCLTSLWVIWMRGSSAPSGNSWTTPRWVCGCAGGQEGSAEGSGQAGSIRPSVRACPWVPTTPWNAPGWGQRGWRAAQQEGTWGCCLTASGYEPECAQGGKKAKGIVALVEKSVASRSRELIAPLCWALGRPHLECCVQFWPLSAKRPLRGWSVSREGNGAGEGSGKHVC